jgi:hypothetical protein
MRFLRCPDSALTKCSIRSYMHYTQLLGLHLRYCQHWTTLNLVDVVRLLWALWAFKVPHSVWSTPSWRTAAACSPCSNPHTTTPLAPLSLAYTASTLASPSTPLSSFPGQTSRGRPTTTTLCCLVCLCSCLFPVRTSLCALSSTVGFLQCHHCQARVRHHHLDFSFTLSPPSTSTITPSLPSQPRTSLLASSKDSPTSSGASSTTGTL